MADIRLNVTGDAGGGVAAMDSMGNSVGKSAVKWQEMANVAKAAASAIAKFAVDSVKAYAESERVQRQLVRAAGEYAGALDEQAKSLSHLYAVDDDVIKQSEILLTQWGGAAAASRDAETAALNLAAAMGTDLNSATQMLIRNVESGGTGLAKMGIHFTATGKRGDDLKAAIEAINKKLGGAAASDAESLVGRTHAAQLAFEDLQKSIGGMLATAMDRTGALGFMTEKLREMTRGGEVLFEVLMKLPGMAGGVLRGNIAAGSALDELKQTAIDAFLGGKTPTALPSNVANDPTNKGMKDAATTKPGRTDEERLEDAKKYYEGIETLADTAAQQDEDNYAKELELSAKRVAADIDESEKRIQTRRDMLLAIEQANAEHAEKDAKDLAKVEEKALKTQADLVAKKAKEARAAGDAIGAAMVNALADQLSKLAEGGEFDAALFIGEILAAAVGVAGSVIGTAFGMPAVGAAIGNLAAMGIRAGSSAISKGNKSNKPRAYHEGGEIERWPRFHSGGGLGPDEVPMIGQVGEHMLSRRDVSNMGGQAGVEAAKRGGGARQIYIQAIDSKSMADTFADRGGDGLKQALRRGQGALPAVFGRGPR